MSDVKCPHCGCSQEINHDDGYGYSEDEVHEQACEECCEPFFYTTMILFRYTVVQPEESND